MCDRCELLKGRKLLTADDMTHAIDAILADPKHTFDAEFVLRCIHTIEDQSRYILEVVAARGALDPNSRLN